MNCLVVFGRDIALPELENAADHEVECAHIWLIARREAVENLVKAGRSTRFQCEACGLLVDP